MKKYNAGDKTGPSTSNIPYGAKCYKPTTSHCSSGGGWDYSGCNRTVCNYDAAKKICENIGWSLPTRDQLVALQNQYTNVSKDKKTSGLQLCDRYNSRQGAPYCDFTGNGACNVSPLVCAPESVIGVEVYNDSSKAYYAQVELGTVDVDESRKSHLVGSVRCVKPL